MKLTLLALFFTLATRNERSAMVRIVNTRYGRRLLVRAGRRTMVFDAAVALPIWLSLPRPLELRRYRS